MIESTDVSAFNWIVKGRDALISNADSAAWKGVFVAHCLPRGFAAYCKLLHPIYEDPSVENRAVTWEEESRANPPSPGSGSAAGTFAAIADGAVLVRRDAGVETPSGSRVLWRTLAEKYELIFHSELNAESFRRAFSSGSWPRYLLGPTEGTLDKATCEALVDVLKPFSQEQLIWFRVSDCLINDLPHLYSGHLDEVTLFLTKAHFGGTPEYWWPDDRTWCVCSDWDLPFTLVGGSRALIDACIKHPALECLEVKPENRVDYRADRINLPEQ